MNHTGIEEDSQAWSTNFIWKFILILYFFQRMLLFMKKRASGTQPWCLNSNPNVMLNVDHVCHDTDAKMARLISCTRGLLNEDQYVWNICYYSFVCLIFLLRHHFCLFLYIPRNFFFFLGWGMSWTPQLSLSEQCLNNWLNPPSELEGSQTPSRQRL